MTERDDSDTRVAPDSAQTLDAAVPGPPASSHRLVGKLVGGKYAVAHLVARLGGLAAVVPLLARGRCLSTGEVWPGAPGPPVSARLHADVLRMTSCLEKRVARGKPPPC